MHISLDKKIALVTGGSGGIGQAIAEALAASGAHVAITYSSHPEPAQATVKKIEDGGGKALAVEADVGDPAAVQAMFDKVEQELGPVDILINAPPAGKSTSPILRKSSTSTCTARFTARSWR
jgi:3-oxoacyl-[acyl-carrier protein] reductase